MNIVIDSENEKLKRISDPNMVMKSVLAFRDIKSSVKFGDMDR